MTGPASPRDGHRAEDVVLLARSEGERVAITPALGAQVEGQDVEAVGDEIHGQSKADPAREPVAVDARNHDDGATRGPKGGDVPAAQDRAVERAGERNVLIAQAMATRVVVERDARRVDPTPHGRHGEDRDDDHDPDEERAENATMPTRRVHRRLPPRGGRTGRAALA